MKGNLAEKSLENLESKKISLNLDVDSIKFIEELSNLTNTTRTTAIISLIGAGMPALLNSLETSWKKMKNDKIHSPEKLDKLLKQITSLRKKYNL
jgi:arsenate reductase-like glutaredoxin family protein